METSRLPVDHSETVIPLRYAPTSQPFPLAAACVSSLARNVIELLFASKDLADERIIGIDLGGPHCLECYRCGLGNRPIEHARSCKTGRVLAAIDELGAWTEDIDLSHSPSERRFSEETSEDPAGAAAESKAPPLWMLGFAFSELPPELDVKTEAGL